MRLFLNREEKAKIDNYESLLDEEMFKTRELIKAESNGRRLYILAVGCHKHPSYRAHRRPTAGCEGCELLFLTAEELRSKGYLLLNARKPGKKAKVV